MFDATELNIKEQRKLIENFRVIYSAIENLRELDSVKRDEDIDDLLFALVNEVFHVENKMYPLKTLDEFDEKESIERFLNYVKSLTDINDIKRSTEHFDNLELYFSNVEIPKKDEYMLAVLLNELEKTSILESRKVYKENQIIKGTMKRSKKNNIITFDFKK